LANHKSAIKRHKQSLKRNKRNTAVKSSLKSITKKVETAVANNNAEDAAVVLKQAVVALDKAAGKGIVHKKTASRKISRLTKKVNAVPPAAPVKTAKAADPAV